MNNNQFNCHKIELKTPNGLQTDNDPLPELIRTPVIHRFSDVFIRRTLYTKPGFYSRFAGRIENIFIATLIKRQGRIITLTSTGKSTGTSKIPRQHWLCFKLYHKWPKYVCVHCFWSASFMLPPTPSPIHPTTYLAKKQCNDSPLSSDRYWLLVFYQ